MSSTDRNKSAQAANSPGWKLVNDRWLWWDGKQYTAEWDGTQTIVISEVEVEAEADSKPAKPPKKPGWAKDPHDSTLLRYWDGSEWGDDRIPRPSVSPRARDIAKTILIVTAALFLALALYVMDQSM